MEETQNSHKEILAHGPVFAISQINKQILEAKGRKPFEDALAKLRNLLADRSNLTDLVVDQFIKRLLLVVPDLPDGKSKLEQILGLLDISLNKRNVFLLQRLISRCLISSFTSTEESTKVLSALAQKYYSQRDFDFFIQELVKTADASIASSTVEFSFSSEFIKAMGDYALKLPITQSLAIVSFICNHLENKSIAAITKFPKTVFGKPCISALLLSTMFLNIKLADYSIREETLNDAIALFQTVKAVLKSLVTSTLSHPKECLGTLLTVAFAFGELQQLLLLYSPLYAEREPVKTLNPETAEDEVWDFSFFHSFASKEQWLQLAESTHQSYAIGWAPLVLQKIRYLILFSGRHRYKQEKLLKKLIAYLIEHFDECQSLWLTNIKYLMPFMTPQQIGTIGKKIVESPETWNRVLLDEDVTEKRTLQMSVICAVFGSIHDRSRKRKSDDEELPLSQSTLTVLRLFTVHVEMWIGGVNRINKEVTGALRQSSQHLRSVLCVTESTTTPKSHQHDLSELLSPLKLLEYLPLEYLSGPVHSSTVMALLSLLLSCSQDSMKSKIWMMIVRLLDKEKSSFLFDYFPCADFMTWAVSNMAHLPESNLIYSTLLDEILKSPKLSKDGFSWVKEIDLKAISLPILVLAMKKLIERKQTGDKVFSSVRKNFLNRIEENLESQLTTVLEGCLYLLETYMERRNQKAVPVAPAAPPKKVGKKSKANAPAKEVVPAEGDAPPVQEATPVKDVALQPKLKIKSLLKSLPKLVTAATQGIGSLDGVSASCCCDFLGFLVVNRMALIKYLTRDPRMILWEAYRTSPNPSSWSGHLLFQIICRTNRKELLTMVNGMLVDLQSLVAKVMEENAAENTSVEVDVNRVSRFFQHLVSIDMTKNKDRFGVRLQAIQTALPLVQHLILSACRNSSDTDRLVRLVIPPMEIYLSLLKSDPVYAYPHDLTSPLHACLSLPLDADMSLENFESIFTVIYKTLHYLLTKHQEVAADRVPVLLQVYRRLMAATCTRSDSRRPTSDSVVLSEPAVLVESANRLARLASVINTQPLRYRRVAAYVIVDLLDDLKKQPLYPNVKQELTTALHHLMDLLDQHAVRYLMAVLPSGARELFRVEYEHFEKFYKYKGKA